MENKDKFSFGRMWLVLKSDLMSNKKQIIYNFITLYGVFMLVELFLLTSHCNFETFTYGYAGTIDVVISILALFYISTIMRPMMTKQKRISFLMLPATNAEKFVSRLLYTTAGFFVLAMLALVAALVSRYIMLPLVSADSEFYTNSAIIPVFKVLFSGDNEAIFDGSKYIMSSEYSTALTCVLVLWTYSIYLLGGSIWYRYAFIKTVASLTVISVGGMIILGLLASLPSFINFVESWPEEWADGTVIAFITIVAAVTIFNVWMSYRLFRRSQVITTNRFR